jgi:hypothetical protein
VANNSFPHDFEVVAKNFKTSLELNVEWFILVSYK